MPPYDDDIADTIYLMAMIMSGTMVFSKFTGGLQLIFASSHKERTMFDKILDLEEELQGYFISHNKMAGNQ